MKKFAITAMIGMALLATSSMALAHPPYNGGVRAAVSVTFPVGRHGYATFATAPYVYPAPYYYPASYVRYDYVRGYGNGYRHGNKRQSKHGKHHDCYVYDDHRHGRHSHH